MKYYIFTQEDCPKCEKWKQEMADNGQEYIERDAARLKNPVDEIDREGLIEASMRNMELPVVVQWYDPIEVAGERYHGFKPPVIRTERTIH